MADLSYIDSTLEVKLVGQNSTGTRANYVGADANGNMTVVTTSAGPVTPGTVALASALIGGQYNSSLPTLTNTQQAAIQVDSSGRLLVGSIANSVAVTGTFWQATQPVSGTVTANAGTGTFAISAASLPLPTGAATSALQTTGNTSLSSIDTKTPALGQALAAASVPVVLTAAQLTTLTPLSTVAVTQSTSPWVVSGTVATTQSGTWTVQPGNTANTTAWLVKDNSLGTVAAGTAGTQSSLIGGVYNTSLPTLTNGQQAALQADSSGRLLVNIGSAVLSATIGVADKTSFTYGTTLQTVIGGVYQDAAPTLTAGTQGAVRLTQYRAQHANLRDNSGNELLTQKTMANSIPVTIASDQSNVPVSQGTASSLNAQVVGDIASGSADSGNPVKIGGVYNSTLPSPSTSQRVDLQVNQFGELSVNLRNNYYNITGNTTHTIKSGSGVLSAISINNATTGGVCTVYDNTTASGTKIMTITLPTGGVNPTPATLSNLGCEFTTGLTVVTTGATDNNFTFFYK